MIEILVSSIVLASFLFFTILFFVGLLRVKDWKISLTILSFELFKTVMIRKNKRIEDHAKFISDSLRDDMKKIVRKKDEELMELFTLDKEEATKLKSAAQHILNNKDSLLISLHDTRILMESADELSFLGSYRKSLEVFSDKNIRAEYNKAVHESRREHYQEIEENYNKKVFKESTNDLIKNIVDKNELLIC